MATRVKGRADKLLESFGSKVVDLTKINLGRSYVAQRSNGKTYRKRIDSSGNLRNSVGYRLEMRDDDGKFTQGRVIFSMAEYGKWVDAGRKPGNGIPTAPLEKWIKNKPLRIRDLETGSFIKATPSRIKSLAFLISRKAKQKGIKPTNFFTDPLEEQYAKLERNLIDAVGEDYLNAVGQDIDELNRK